MDGRPISWHFHRHPLSMIVHDFNAFWTFFRPDETNAVTVVNPEGILPFYSCILENTFWNFPCLKSQIQPCTTLALFASMVTLQISYSS